MTSSEPLLDRAAIGRILSRLAERLDARGVTADLYVFGGAAMAMAYDARRATRDIDAVFVPHGIVLEEAQAVAREFGLPNWWLNEQASVYVAPGADTGAPRIIDRPGLRVTTASPEHLLAMKALAARPRDLDDIKLLADHLHLTRAEQVTALCARVFPDEPLPDRARLQIEDLLDT